MRRAGAFVESFAGYQAMHVENDRTDAWVGVTERSARGELKGTAHQGDVELTL
jgi:hypothetical protein